MTITSTNTSTPPAGWTANTDPDDGTLIDYEGPTITVGRLKIMQAWHPRDGHHYYIDTEMNEAVLPADLRKAIETFQQLIDEAEAHSQP